MDYIYYIYLLTSLLRVAFLRIKVDKYFDTFTNVPHLIRKCLIQYDVFFFYSLEQTRSLKSNESSAPSYQNEYTLPQEHMELRN